MRPLDRRGDASSRLYTDINFSISDYRVTEQLSVVTVARRYVSFFRWIFTNFGHPFAPKILETGFSFNFLLDRCQGKCKRYRVSSMKTGSKCYRPDCFINNIPACTEIYLKRNFTISIVYRLFEFHTRTANDELPSKKKINTNSFKDAKPDRLIICIKPLWQLTGNLCSIITFAFYRYTQPLFNELTSKYTARRLRGHDLNLEHYAHLNIDVLRDSTATSQ
jgi:hypothetical protein